MFKCEYLPVLFLVGIYICFLSVFCNEYPIMNNGVKDTQIPDYDA